MKKAKWIAGVVSAAFVMMCQAVPASAAETKAEVPAEASDCSYLAGRQRSMKRNAVYAKAAEIEDEGERKAFLIENGISDTEYSEEAAAPYSYVKGQKKGAKYRSGDDTETQSSYSYAAGQKRGSGYRR